MLKIFVFSSFLIISVCSLSQVLSESDRLKLKKIERYTNRAKELIEKNKYVSANTLLIKARRVNFENNPQLAVYNTAFATMYYKIGAYESANRYEKSILANTSAKLNRYYAYSNIGTNFLQLNWMDSAIFYYKKQLILSRKHLDYLGVSSSLNNIGLCYLRKKNHRKALVFFKESYELLRKNKDVDSHFFPGEYENMWITINDNLGANYFELGEYAKAKKLLELVYIENDYEFGIYNQYYLNEIYCRNQLFNESKSLISKCFKNCDRNNVNHLNFIAEMKLDLALYSNNQTESIRLSKLRKQYDSILTSKKKQQLNELSKMVSHFLEQESKSAIKRMKLERKLLKKEVLINSKERNFVVWVLLLLLTASITVFYLFRQSSRNKQQQLLLNEKKLELELNERELTIRMQKINLIDYALSIDKNKDYEATIIKKISDIIKETDQEKANDLKSLLLELKQKSQSSHDSNHETVNHEEALQQFRFHLLEKHPFLKKSEIQLCQYTLLELSNKDIGLIKGITPESVKIAKNRLKHKLNIEKDMSLQEYLKEIHHYADGN